MRYNLLTKFDIDKEAYTIKNVKKVVSCPLCQKTHLILESSVCPCCHGNGAIDLPDTTWVAIKEPMKIKRIKISLNLGNCTIRYKGKCGNVSIERSEKNLFSTYEKAVWYCNYLNRVSTEIEIAKIKITPAFSHGIPSSKKIAARIEEYKSSGTFKTEIILTKDMVLVDGYTTYLCCKMLGIEKWTVGILGDAQEDNTIKVTL